LKKKNPHLRTLYKPEKQRTNGNSTKHTYKHTQATRTIDEKGANSGPPEE